MKPDLPNACRWSCFFPRVRRSARQAPGECCPASGNAVDENEKKGFINNFLDNKGLRVKLGG
jgi:hypothetical protein